MCSPRRGPRSSPGATITRVGRGRDRRVRQRLRRLHRRDSALIGDHGAHPARLRLRYGPPSASGTTPHHGPDAGRPLRPVSDRAGFNYFYGFIAGETSQYEPRLWRNTTPVEPEHADDYHLTEEPGARRHRLHPPRTGRSTRTSRSSSTSRPRASTAPHHVPAEWADKYSGQFDDGWETLREKTFAKQKELGWFHPRPS